MKNARNAGRKPSTNVASAQQQGPVQSLTRALNLLESLSDTDMGMTLTDVASQHDLAPSTAHRLLNSLAASGYVDLDEETGLWSVGLKAFVVGSGFLKKRDIVSQSRPVMKELVAETGETANLALLEDRNIVFIAQVECSEVMRMVVNVGSRGPLHAAGVGKAMLSAMPLDQALSRVRETGMPALTEKTLTSEEAFAGELEIIRERGYSVDDEEQKNGLRCVAANIYDEHGEAIAAVSISGPSVRVTENRVASLAGCVIEAAGRITTLIGGKKPALLPPTEQMKMLAE